MFRTALITMEQVTVSFPITKHFFLSSSHLVAAGNVNLKINAGDVFCLIGESGSGKSTIIKTVLGFHPYQGTVFYKGQPLKKNGTRRHLPLRREAQLVFQDPWASLSPYHSLQWSIEEPLRARAIRLQQRRVMAAPLIKRLDLSKDVLKRTPSRVSGGECQRACIARALINRPRMLFLDEPLSSLDAHIRKQTADLLVDLRQEYDLTYFMISHDLTLVKKMATTVMVLYLGRVMELSPAGAFFSDYRHPYSRALLSSVLTPGFWKGPRIVLQNEIPSPVKPPAGCVFHTRCREKTARCATEVPPLHMVGPSHFVACHRFCP